MNYESIFHRDSARFEDSQPSQTKYRSTGFDRNEGTLQGWPSGSHDTQTLANSRANAAPLSLEILQSNEELQSNSAAWNSLIERVPSTVFQTFEWISLWWRHFGADPDRSLYVCCFRSGRRLVGIVPLFRETRTLVGITVCRKLRLMGCGVAGRGERRMFDRYSPTDFLDGIIDPEFAPQIAAALNDHLAENSESWDELDLSNLLDDSFFIKHFVPLFDQRFVKTTVRASDICPFLSYPTRSKDFILTLKSTVRRRMASALKGLGEGIETVVECPETGADIERTFNDMVQLHQVRWNKLGYTGVFSDERYSRFQAEVAQVFSQRGWLWLKSVRVDGATIAVRLGFNFKGRMYCYTSGFDDHSPAARKRPGMGLLLLMIDDAARESAESFEFLRGAEQYKFDFTNLSTTLQGVRLKNPHTKAHVRQAINNVQEAIDAGAYRAFVEITSLRQHVTNSSALVGTGRYLTFRAKCAKEFLRSKLYHDSSVTV